EARASRIASPASTSDRRRRRRARRGAAVAVARGRRASRRRRIPSGPRAHDRRARARPADDRGPCAAPHRGATGDRSGGGSFFFTAPRLVERNRLTAQDVVVYGPRHRKILDVRTGTFGG